MNKLNLTLDAQGVTAKLENKNKKILDLTSPRALKSFDERVATDHIPSPD